MPPRKNDRHPDDSWREGRELGVSGDDGGDENGGTQCKEWRDVHRVEAF
ncbi:MAG: hypothetical protein ABL994_26290 [Verrucomicrobiales bacterium]